MPGMTGPVPTNASSTLWKYVYAFKNISYQHHWLKNCWVFCPLGIVIYFKLLLWRWGWTSWESLYGNSWPLYECWATRIAPDQPLKAWDELLGCWWSNLPPGIAGLAAFHLQHGAEAAAPCSPWGAGRQWDVHQQHGDPSHGVVALCIWYCSSEDAFTVWNFFPYSAAKGQSLLQMFSTFTGKRMRRCRFI